MADRNLHPAQFEPEYMSVAKLKNLPSADAPGRTVGEILDAKRLARGHADHVAQVRETGVMRPVHINAAGALVDGHHRVAAAEDARQQMVPYVRDRAE